MAAVEAKYQVPSEMIRNALEKSLLIYSASRGFNIEVLSVSAGCVLIIIENVELDQVKSLLPSKLSTHLAQQKSRMRNRKRSVVHKIDFL